MVPGYFSVFLLVMGTAIQAQTSLKGAALIEALQEGGYVIYFRHAATDRGGVDSIDMPPEQQRNLSKSGIADSKAIGDAFRKLAIPVGRVLASPFERTKDTARLAFGRVEARSELLGLLSDDAGARKRAAFLRRMLNTPPAPGKNRILSAHYSNIQRVAGITLAESEAAVFRPMGSGGFELVATLMPEDWVRLASASGVTQD